MTDPDERSAFQRAYDESVAEEAERVRNLSIWEQVRESPTYFAGMALLFAATARLIRALRERWRGHSHSCG